MLLRVGNGRSRNRGCTCEGGVSNLLFCLPCGLACIPFLCHAHGTLTVCVCVAQAVLQRKQVVVRFASQMRNLDTTTELDPKGDKFTCPAFWPCTPLQQSTPRWDIVLDLTSLACQPKSCERHLTFSQSEQKSAYPAHTRDLEEDEDDEFSVCPDGTAASEDEDDQSLVQPASRQEPVEEKA